jgi:hypothetical protein
VIVQWGLLHDDYYRSPDFGRVPRKILIGAAISEAHGVLGLVQQRLGGLRRDRVSVKEKNAD